MHVLQLTSHLNVGGITTHVVSLSEALTRLGHRVVVGSGGGSLQQRVAEGGMTHWRLSLHTSAEFSPQVAWAAWLLSRKLSRHPVEVIHAHTRVAQVVAHWLWKTHRLPYVTTWHGFYRRRVSRRWLSCTGLRTIAISEPVVRHLHDDFKVPAERIRLIPHGVDVSRFAQPVDPQDAQRLRKQLGLASQGPVIGTVARLVASKGVAQLLEGFCHITASIPQAQLLVVGDGTQRRELERLANRLGVAGAVRFAGSLPHTRVALSLMDVFVFVPATQEGFGLSLLEAMASGLPIVAVRRGGGASWVLEESQVGLTVAPDDPAGLGEALLRCLSDPSYARQLGLQGFAVAKARYDLERMVSQVERVYAEVIADAQCEVRSAEFRIRGSR
jgi:glycosyltransferase involved in cell wall biosynthesis